VKQRNYWYYNFSVLFTQIQRDLGEYQIVGGDSIGRCG